MLCAKFVSVHWNLYINPIPGHLPSFLQCPIAYLKLEKIHFVQYLPKVADVLCDPTPDLSVRLLYVHRQGVLDSLNSLALESSEKRWKIERCSRKLKNRHH